MFLILQIFREIFFRYTRITPKLYCILIRFYPYPSVSLSAYIFFYEENISPPGAFFLLPSASVRIYADSV